MDDRERFLEEYLSGVGSSDCAAVCGYDSYRTPLDIYLRKRRLVTDADNIHMQIGRAMEPVIAQQYEERTGRKLITQPVKRHKDHPWMIAHLDRATEDGAIVVECKSASFRQAAKFGDEFTDQVPEEFLFQTQHQLAVADVDVADIAVLLDRDLRIYTTYRNDAMIKSIISIEKEFWDRVLAGDAPPPDFTHRHTPQLLKSMYGLREGVTIDLDPATIEAWGKYKQIGQEINTLKDLRDAEQAKVLFALGEAEAGRLSPDFEIIRKQIAGTTFTATRKPYLRLFERKVLGQ